MRNDAERDKKPEIWWDTFFLRLCREYSTGSKDPTSKVAAALVKDHELYVIGYNGFPKGMYDNPLNYAHRETKLKKTIHAEVNVIERYFKLFPNSKESGFTLYVYPYFPCDKCAIKIVGSGMIDRVVSTDYLPDRWKSIMVKSKNYLDKHHIKTEEIPINQVL